MARSARVAAQAAVEAARLEPLEAAAEAARMRAEAVAHSSAREAPESLVSLAWRGSLRPRVAAEAARRSLLTQQARQVQQVREDRWRPHREPA